MKTGTSCSRCANAATCPKFDNRTMYGFCRGFEPRRKRKKLRRAYPALRWLKIWGLTRWYASVSFLKIWGKMGGGGSDDQIQSRKQG